MYRILHVYPQLNCGGTEMVFYNLIKFGDKTNYQYDILVQRKGDNEIIFEQLGCKIYTIPYKDKHQYYIDIAKFFSQNKFQAVHAHMHGAMPVVLKEASKAGVPHCIAHSHNARIDIPRILWPLRYFKHHCYEKYATDLFGCSELALKWFYPFRWREGIVIYNGIDLDSFQFNLTTRVQYRKKLGVSEDTKVIINVGRCTEQKNQQFILDRAKDEKDENILFVIIGEGPLMSGLQNRIDTEGITNVRMLGKQFDVPQWLCAADVFIFPSIYEGLGIVAIEAQASGLRVLSTDTIPAEADMEMGSFERISLSDTRRWEELLKEETYSPKKRKELSELAFSTHYNIRVVAKQVEKLYMSILNGKE